jgi:hypothetical protein
MAKGKSLTVVIIKNNELGINIINSSFGTFKYAVLHLLLGLHYAQHLTTLPELLLIQQLSLEVLPVMLSPKWFI